MLKDHTFLILNKKLSDSETNFADSKKTINLLKQEMVELVKTNANSKSLHEVKFKFNIYSP